MLHSVGGAQLRTGRSAGRAEGPTKFQCLMRSAMSRSLDMEAEMIEAAGCPRPFAQQGDRDKASLTNTSRAVALAHRMSNTSAIELREISGSMPDDGGA